MHNAATSFVELDKEMLSTFCAVTEYALHSRRVSPLATWKAVRAHDLVFGWFASWHTFLPLLFARLMRKPSILVIGGYDLACLPAIGYGHQRGGPKHSGSFKKWISRATMNLATRLITNSRFSQNEARVNANIRPERVTVIYHGVPDRFGAADALTRERLALTVGNVSQSNLSRKGLESFVRAAALLPDVSFVLAGRCVDDAFDYLKSIATPNVTLTGWIEDAELIHYYQRASVYVQVSQHEGFGMSLAEAMLAGCIPVVTSVCAIPEVTGESAIFTPSQAPEAVANAVTQALAAPQSLGAQARDRINRLFPLRRRRDALEAIVKSLLPSPKI